MNEIKKYLAEIGRKGGQSKSKKKVQAARKNIRKRWAHKQSPNAD